MSRGLLTPLRRLSANATCPAAHDASGEVWHSPKGFFLPARQAKKRPVVPNDAAFVIFERIAFLWLILAMYYSQNYNPSRYAAATSRAHATPL